MILSCSGRLRLLRSLALILAESRKNCSPRSGGEGDLSSHGVPNTTLLQHLPRQRIRALSWNTRALFARKASVGVPKQRKVRKMAYSNDILLLQEVHGTEHDVISAFGWLSRDFRMWFFK
eukprot:2600283-Karenia_brevis.AAC.1